MRVACVVLFVLALSGCSEVAGTTPIRETGAVAERPGKAERTCRPVRAMATGFGERNVSDFAEGNLSLAIDKAKDEMASEGGEGLLRGGAGGEMRVLYRFRRLRGPGA